MINPPKAIPISLMWILICALVFSVATTLYLLGGLLISGSQSGDENLHSDVGQIASSQAIPTDVNQTIEPTKSPSETPSILINFLLTSIS